MKEVLYVISGKRLPVVFHVGARALTSQALNIHAGHDDVMSVADTGWGILFARNVQEAADLTAIARRVAEETETPFFVVPGRLPDDPHAGERASCRRTSCCASSWAIRATRIRDLFDPAEALMTGVVQNQDSYMKGRVAQRAWYDRIPGVMADAFAEWDRLTGRRYGALDAYRTEDADRIVVAMGTIADSLPDVVDHLRANGVARRLRRSHFIPTISCRPARSDPCHRESGRSRRADRRTGSVRQPTHARAESRTRRSGRRRRANTACRLGLGGVRFARRFLSRSARRVRVAGRRATDGRAAVRGPRSQAPTRPRSCRYRASPARGVQPARSFDRRLRVGHGQQAAGQRHRRTVRPVRAGLSALWLRETRATDDLLPDHRRGADPPAQRVAPGGAGAAARRQRIRPG